MIPLLVGLCPEVVEERNACWHRSSGRSPPSRGTLAGPRLWKVGQAGPGLVLSHVRGQFDLISGKKQWAPVMRAMSRKEQWPWRQSQSRLCRCLARQRGRMALVEIFLLQRVESYSFTSRVNPQSLYSSSVLSVDNQEGPVCGADLGLDSPGTLACSHLTGPFFLHTEKVDPEKALFA